MSDSTRPACRSTYGGFAGIATSRRLPGKTARQLRKRTEADQGADQRRGVGVLLGRTPAPPVRHCRAGVRLGGLQLTLYIKLGKPRAPFRSTQPEFDRKVSLLILKVEPSKVCPVCRVHGIMFFRERKQPADRHAVYRPRPRRWKLLGETSTDSWHEHLASLGAHSVRLMPDDQGHPTPTGIVAHQFECAAITDQFCQTAHHGADTAAPFE